MEIRYVNNLFSDETKKLVAELIKKGNENYLVTVKDNDSKDYIKIVNISDDLYLLFFSSIIETFSDELYNEKYDIKKRIKKFKKKYGTKNDTVVSNFLIPVAFFDSFYFEKDKRKISFSELVDNIKNIVNTKTKENISSYQIINYIIENFGHIYGNIEDLTLQIADSVYFEIVENSNVDINNNFVSCFITSKYNKHLYYKIMKKLLKMTEYLIQSNITDAYDGYFMEGINKKDLIFEDRDAVNEIEVYTIDCNNNLLYCCVSGGFFSKIVNEYIFVDNKFVRRNLHLLRHLTENFLGLELINHPKIIKKIKNLPISNERKEKLLNTSLCEINTMRFITPQQDGDSYVCKVCNNVIVKMSKDFYESCLPYLKEI